MRTSHDPGATVRSFARFALLVLAGCTTSSPDADPDTSTVEADALEMRPADPVKTAALAAKASSLVRPGSVLQIEPRLGVPTIVWTRDQRGPSAAAAIAAGALRPEVDVARAVLADYAPLYGLADDDVAGAVIAGVHDAHTGPIIVKLRSELAGIEIFREELNVVMNRKLEPVALTGYLTSAATPPARAGGLGFAMTAPAATAAALRQIATVDPTQVVAAGTRDGYQLFTLTPAAAVPLDEPIRVKKVYYHLPDGLEAAYYIELIARTGAPPPGVLAADGSLPAISEGFSYVVSAATGQLLFRKNLGADAAPLELREANALGAGGFTYRVWADPATGIPYDTPAGNAVHPKVVPAPDGAQAAFLPTNDLTLPNFPFSQNDPWLPPGATETNGNNADAFLNLFAPDGLGNPNTQTPADPPNGDFRAQITAPGQFLHTQTPDDNVANAEGRGGAIQQLFYDINFLHDWYYDVGFDEVAGNAQTNNFGRGGAGGDSIKGQAQDFAGFSNANMLTPADGSQPRMRMYLFPSPLNMIEIEAPAAIAGKAAFGISMSGPQTFDLTGDIAVATFTSGPTTCTVTNAAALAGKIAMFDFDNTDGTGCSFGTRIARLTSQTSAMAILMVYTSAPASANLVANISGFVTTNIKPVGSVSWNTGQAIKGQLGGGVTARLFRVPDRDGALDNQIIAHEWFHYVSNRLIGNGAGLNTNLSSGLGEGWSDFNAMILTVREDDSQTPSNSSFDGTYALATYATSGTTFNGVPNHSYYFGIRRYPYSTDMTKNPLTFKHIAKGIALPVGPFVAFGSNGANNQEVHNTGEVWTTMLWECYAALLRDTLGATPRLSFAQAQDRMKRYLIAALKVTPLYPTIPEARDALLAVALATDTTDYVEFRAAFARRGAGRNAVSPDRFTPDNVGVVEDFTVGPDVALDSAALDDSLGSCDDDGVMDHGEYGRLTVTLRNVGTTTLAQATATVSSPSPDVWYPTGSTVAFPSIAPGATASTSLRVAYLRTVAGIQTLDFQINYTDPQLAGPLSSTVSFRTNTDALAAAASTDDAEATASTWTTGFAAGLGNVAPWKRTELSTLSHLWHVDDFYAASDQYLISRPLTVDGSGSLNLQFDHSWSFESSGGLNFDGGVVEMSVNGGAFGDIGSAVYNGAIATYNGDLNPLKGRNGLVGSSGTVHASLTQAVAPGSAVVLRFREGSDSSVGVGGWNIDNIAVTGIVETPFALVTADAHACAIVPTSADLAIAVSDGVASVTAGGSVTYTITASNAVGDDVIGAAVVDSFPAELTCAWTCAGSAGGSCSASGTGNILDQVSLPVGGAATYTASCAVSSSTATTQLTNTAAIAPPGPPGTVSDAVPGNNMATDIDALIRIPAHLVASKTVSGSFVEGGTVAYTIVLTDDGPGATFDNAGNELIDVLPAGLSLVSANATAGTVVATPAVNTVTWNGGIAAGSSVTITIVATIVASAGTAISNQAGFTYDADGDTTNDATGATDAYACPP